MARIELLAGRVWYNMCSSVRFVLIRIFNIIHSNYNLKNVSFKSETLFCFRL